jgi:hypothetical protein
MWWKRFCQSEDGVSLVLVTITLPVILGLGLLVIDGSRFYSLHNDLQKAADAFALAAAAELDGANDAIERADRALANLVQNVSSFSTEGTSNPFDVETEVVVRYLSDIPEDDDLAIEEDMVTTDPNEAIFAEVSIVPHDMLAIFPASFIGGPNTISSSATAVAGFAGVVVCEMTPLFMCNPFEPQHPAEVASEGNFYGKGMRLVEGGSDGQWGPGNFGFLRPQEEHGYGARELTQDIARASVPQCISSRGLYFRTGGPTPSIEGVNVRFDIYQGGHVSKTNASMPPGPNFRKGYRFSNTNNPNACNMDPVVEGAPDWNQFRQLEMDECLKTLSCEGTASVRIGDGLWDYEGYLDANGFTDADMAGFTDSEGQTYSNDNPPSRFELYKYELLQGLDAEASLGGETARAPRCASTVSSDPDRRLIYGALVNCIEEAAHLNGQSGGPVPAVGFASFFVTEPVSARTNNDMIVEIIDIDGLQGRGTMLDFAKDQVQLYR